MDPATLATFDFGIQTENAASANRASLETHDVGSGAESLPAREDGLPDYDRSIYDKDLIMETHEGIVDILNQGSIVPAPGYDIVAAEDAERLVLDGRIPVQSAINPASISLTRPAFTPDPYLTRRLEQGLEERLSSLVGTRRNPDSLHNARETFLDLQSRLRPESVRTRALIATALEHIEQGLAIQMPEPAPGSGEAILTEALNEYGGHPPTLAELRTRLGDWQLTEISMAIHAISRTHTNHYMRQMQSLVPALEILNRIQSRSGAAMLSSSSPRTNPSRRPNVPASEASGRERQRLREQALGSYFSELQQSRETPQRDA